MSVNSLRADGWQEAAAFLVMMISAVYFWYMNDLYLNWIVFVIGIGAGAIVYNIFEFAENHPIAGFPITMVVIIAMLAAVMIKSLVPGAVSALTVVTAIKIYEVYLS